MRVTGSLIASLTSLIERRNVPCVRSSVRGVDQLGYIASIIGSLSTFPNGLVIGPDPCRKVNGIVPFCCKGGDGEVTSNTSEDDTEPDDCDYDSLGGFPYWPCVKTERRNCRTIEMVRSE